MMNLLLEEGTRTNYHLYMLMCASMKLIIGRLSFTTDASLLIVPAGCLNKRRGDQTEQVYQLFILLFSGIALKMSNFSD